MLYWLLKRVLVGPALRTVFRPTVEGLEHIPDAGPAILAINHLSYSDWLFVPLVVERRVTFVAKSEYFTTPGVKGRLQKGFFSGTGQVPIDRTSGSAAAAAPAPWSVISPPSIVPCGRWHGHPDKSRNAAGPSSRESVHTMGHVCPEHTVSGDRGP